MYDASSIENDHKTAEAAKLRPLTDRLDRLEKKLDLILEKLACVSILNQSLNKPRR